MRSACSKPWKNFLNIFQSTLALGEDRSSLFQASETNSGQLSNPWENRPSAFPISEK
jgi:hypothetical protein